MRGDDELRADVRHTAHTFQQGQLPLWGERGFRLIQKIEPPSRAGQKYLQKPFAMGHLMQMRKSSAVIVFTSLRRQSEVAFRAQEEA